MVGEVAATSRLKTPAPDVRVVAGDGAGPGVGVTGLRTENDP